MVTRTPHQVEKVSASQSGPLSGHPVVSQWILSGRSMGTQWTISGHPKVISGHQQVVRAHQWMISRSSIVNQWVINGQSEDAQWSLKATHNTTHHTKSDQDGSFGCLNMIQMISNDSRWSIRGSLNGSSGGHSVGNQRMLNGHQQVLKGQSVDGQRYIPWSNI